MTCLEHTYAKSCSRKLTMLPTTYLAQVNLNYNAVVLIEVIVEATVVRVVVVLLLFCRVHFNQNSPFSFHMISFFLADTTSTGRETSGFPIWLIVCLSTIGLFVIVFIVVLIYTRKLRRTDAE